LGSQSGASIAKDVEKNLAMAVAFAVLAVSSCGDDGVDGGCELNFVRCCGVAFALS